MIYSVLHCKLTKSITARVNRNYNFHRKFFYCSSLHMLPVLILLAPTGGAAVTNSSSYPLPPPTPSLLVAIAKTLFYYFTYLHMKQYHLLATQLIYSLSHRPQLCHCVGFCTVCSVWHGTGEYSASTNVPSYSNAAAVISII